MQDISWQIATGLEMKRGSGYYSLARATYGVYYAAGDLTFIGYWVIIGKNWKGKNKKGKMEEMEGFTLLLHGLAGGGGIRQLWLRVYFKDKGLV